MKKLSLILALILTITACSKQNEQAANTNTETVIEQVAVQPAPALDDEVYSFDINTLEPGCSNESQMICAINMSIKCTINPQFVECEEHKKAMPKFVFMEDENLKRPTSQSYKISKIKPLEDGNVEIYTQSTCNGNWFGLCNGNIIYTMSIKNGQWVVKDLYAIES